jgi:hypothetical protein
MKKRGRARKEDFIVSPQVFVTVRVVDKLRFEEKHNAEISSSRHQHFLRIDCPCLDLIIQRPGCSFSKLLVGKLARISTIWAHRQVEGAIFGCQHSSHT